MLAPSGERAVELLCFTLFLLWVCTDGEIMYYAHSTEGTLRTVYLYKQLVGTAGPGKEATPTGLS